MGSAVLIVLATAITVFQVSSCQKISAEPTTVVIHDTINICPDSSKSVLGLWIGTYTINGSPQLGTQYTSYVIKPDGTVTNESMGSNVRHFNIGNWSMNGDTLVCYTDCVFGSASNIGVKQKHIAIFNKTKGTFSSAIWQNFPNPTGSGVLTLTKIK